MHRRTLFWRRTDVQGLERLELACGTEKIEASSTVICLESGGFRLEHQWVLSPDWRAQSVSVQRWDALGLRTLHVERDGDGWRVDRRPRPDLADAEEPDLSVTPFCNTFPIRRTPARPGAGVQLVTAYIDADAMTVARSSQRYDRQGPGRVRYVDLGLSLGFEADLIVDDDGLVLEYEHLFERVNPVESR